MAEVALWRGIPFEITQEISVPMISWLQCKARGIQLGVECALKTFLL
jgi:hypothetical protein